jgi:hypothetical protein
MAKAKNGKRDSGSNGDGTGSNAPAAAAAPGSDTGIVASDTAGSGGIAGESSEPRSDDGNANGADSGGEIDGGLRGGASEPPAGTGTGSEPVRRGRGRPRGSGKRSGTGTAEGQEKLASEIPTRLDREPAPRKVRGVVDEDEPISTPANTRQLLEDLYTGVFWVPAQVLGESHWELNGEEKILAERTDSLIKSQGKARAKRVQKAIDKYLPGLSLVVALALIVKPRLQITNELKRAKHIRQSAEHRGQANAPVDSGFTATRGDTQPTPQGGGGSPEVRERPLTSADISRIGGSEVESNFG